MALSVGKHVRSHVSDVGNSGRVVLNVSFVEADP